MDLQSLWWRLEPHSSSCPDSVWTEPAGPQATGSLRVEKDNDVLRNLIFDRLEQKLLYIKTPVQGLQQ